VSNPFDEADEENPFDKREPGETRALTEDHGVKRLELHKVPAELPPEDDAPEPEKPGLVDSVVGAIADRLRPETTTGAFATGVNKGAALGFGDELYGALHGGVEFNQELIDKAFGRQDVEKAKVEGHFDPSAGAPEIPGVTSYTLKRPGAADVTKAAASHSPSDTITPETWTDAYRKARDSMRETYSKAETAHPAAFLAGELGGSLAVPLPGPGKAKGLAKVGKYALTGAGVGALSGLGNSDADIADVGDWLPDVAKSAAGSAVLGGVLGYGASKIDPALERAAARRAYKALDPYMATIAEGIGPKVASGEAPVSEATAEMERLGRRALDEGIIPEGPLSRFAGSENINERAVSKLRETGTLKGAFVDHAADELAKAGRESPVSLGRLATQLEQQAAEAKVSGNQKLARRLLSEAREVRQTIVDRASAGFEDPAAQTLQEAERFKTMKQGEVDYGRPLESREAQTAVARLAKEQAEKAIEGGLGPEELETFKALKDRYGDLATLAKTSGHGAIRNIRNQTMGLGDKIAASAGAHAAAGPMAIPAAIATGAAHHAANHRGSAGLARTMSNAAKRMSPLVTPGAEFLSEDDADQRERWERLFGRSVER